MKRLREDGAQDNLLRKRIRAGPYDRLSVLSDELLLRTLSYLSVSELVLCQRLSRRLQALGGDLQLWKALFYDRFVRPRASRIPGLRDQGPSAKSLSLYYSSKLSRWLDDDYLVRRGKATNWKRQYKLRHNWSKGRAIISETRIAEHPSTPPLLVRLRNDTIIIADANTGLRAWVLRGERRLIASTVLSPCGPSSLAIDETEGLAGELNIAIGFDDGGFAIYTLPKEERGFVERHKHAPSTNGAILAIAYASPYLLTMTAQPLLSLYRVGHCSNTAMSESLAPPRLLSSLRSHTAYPPISLAIRTSHASIMASIAYAMPTWTKGWSIGLQELRLTNEGTIEDSRVTTSQSTSNGMQPSSRAIIPPGQSIDSIGISSFTRPTSLSYNHPYLLSTHSDNTLTLYMVTSNAKELSIATGHRLWGHTSSVSSAHVGDRGKAVSVSALGGELRVWELEGGLTSSISRRRAAAGDFSVQVRPENRGVLESRTEMRNEQVDVSDIDLSRSGSHGLLNANKGWVAFDEEKVVLLQEQMQGAQALVVYDFS